MRVDGLFGGGGEEVGVGVVCVCVVGVNKCIQLSANGSKRNVTRYMHLGVVMDDVVSVEL